MNALPPESSIPSVDLTVNVYRGDAGFFEPTYRHALRQLQFPFAKRRIAVDRSTPTGRFSDVGEQQALDAQLARLQEEGLVDIVEDVDWSDEAISEVSERYFGIPNAPTRCASGTSVYQYLWALDRCDAAYVLHLDSDILLHLRDGRAWIDDAITLMGDAASVVVATPAGGPPQAQGVREWLLGERHGTGRTEKWQQAQSVSTRYFLIDRERFVGRVCPLDLDRPGERLEESLTLTLARRGLERRSLVDDHNYALHPRRHNANYLQNLDALIGLVEAGRYPFRRTGFRWDIRTEGRHFIPWRLKIAFSRLAR